MNRKNSNQRCGVFVVGCWVVESVKNVEGYPAAGGRARICSTRQRLGGAALDLLLGVARTGLRAPLLCAGAVGADEPGRQILALCRKSGLDVRVLDTIRGCPTGSVDVVIDVRSGSRTEFWYLGANAKAVDAVPDWKKIPARIVHLSNLGLLEQLHAPDAKFGSKSARLLATGQQAGAKTSLGLFGECTHTNFPIIQSALKAVDYCIVDEADACVLTGFHLRNADGRIDPVGVRHAAGAILQQGPRELVVVHFGEGAFARTRKGEDYWQMSVKLPSGKIANRIGISEAFCGAVLAGLHEGWPIQRTLETAMAMAAAAAVSPVGMQGVKSMATGLALAKKYRFNPPVESQDLL